MIKLLNKLRILLPPVLKWQAVLLLVLMVLAAFLELAGLAMLMPAVMAFTDPQALQEGSGVFSRLYQFSRAGSPEQFIYLCAGGIALFYLLKNGFAILQIKAQSTFAMRLSNNIADRLFKRYLNVPYQVFTGMESSALTLRLNRAQEFSSELFLPLLFVWTELCVFAVIGITILLMEPLAACFVLVAALAAFFLFYLPVKRRIERYGKENHEAAEGMFSLLSQVFGSLGMIRLTRTQEYFSKRFRNVQECRSDRQKRSSDCGQMPRFAMETFGVILLMGVIVIAVLSGKTFSGSTAAGAAFFAAAFVRLMPGVSRIQYNMLHIRTYKHLFDVLSKDLTGFPQEKAAPENGTDLTFRKELKLEDISFRYSPETPVILDKFSLTLGRQEAVALVGTTGAGKSTLAHIAAGFLTPDAGKVTVDGIDIQENLPAWQKQIGCVPQNIFLLNGSVAENVAFGVEPEAIDLEKVKSCLETAQLLDFALALPDGLNSVIGESGAKLSGGQRQRLAIARALYRDPALLILDEATSALDSETENAFIDALRNLHGKTAILMIAHRQESLRYCDRIVKI
ncbi:MAG: ABC transporter ATP-binding protein [Lentisphaerae bacterium]|nr:ABC transporter ATP-binding protein [Lentisphaerota bacterium]